MQILLEFGINGVIIKGQTPTRCLVAEEKTVMCFAFQDFDHRYQRGSRKPPAEPHTSASAQPLILPNPYTSDQFSRG